MSDSDDDLVLSEHAQRALAQFLAEQQAAAEVENSILNDDTEDSEKAGVELKEDWQLSQE